MREEHRLSFIDAARGTAMFLVFLAHFGTGYLFELQPDITSFLWPLTMIASPTFMAISGVMLGYLYRGESTFQEIRVKLIDRGLFILIVGHTLIAFAHIQKSAGILDALVRWEFITDTIGFCILVGPLLMERTTLIGRVLMALFIFTFSWLSVFFLRPDSWEFMYLKEAFVGSLDRGIFYYSFPFLPWLSFYLINTCVGERIAVYQRNIQPERISRTFLVLGSTFFLLALSLKFGYKMLHASFWVPCPDILSSLTSPYQKIPPSPVYFLTYGSMAYFILFFLFQFRAWKTTRLFVRVSSILGRNSLFAFILQYFIYFGLFVFLRLPYSPFWPFYLIGSAASIIGAAYLWEKRHLNRLFTLGTVRYWKRDRSGKPARKTFPFRSIVLPKG
jgi:uncharacterized membrane protein